MGLLQINGLLRRRYVIVCLIGRDGIGAVYETVDTLSGRCGAEKAIRQRGLNLFKRAAVGLPRIFRKIRKV